MFAGLVSTAYDKTLVNEIQVVPRDYKIIINNNGVIKVSINAATINRQKTIIVEKITSLNKYLHS